MRCAEFLYFYLMPETPMGGSTRGYCGTGGMWGVGPRNSMSSTADDNARSMEEKKALLGRHLGGNVDGFMQDLEDAGFMSLDVF